MASERIKILDRQAIDKSQPIPQSQPNPSYQQQQSQQYQQSQQQQQFQRQHQQSQQYQQSQQQQQFQQSSPLKTSTTIINPQQSVLKFKKQELTMAEVDVKHINEKFGLQIRKLYKLTQLCQICYSENEGNLITIQCGDTFHQQCLSEYAVSLIQSRNLKLICPRDQCIQKLTYSTLRKLDLKDQFDRYLRFELEQIMQQNTNITYCPTPQCQYIFVRTAQAVKDGNKMLCELCNKQYCLDCKSDWHPMYKSCEEFRRTRDPKSAQQAFNELVEGEHYKMCDKCQSWVSKSQGCNHMTCRCGYEFCYKCGRRYKDPDCKCPLYDHHN